MVRGCVSLLCGIMVLSGHIHLLYVGLEETKKALLLAGHRGGLFTFILNPKKKCVFNYLRLPVINWKPLKHNEIVKAAVSHARSPPLSHSTHTHLIITHRTTSGQLAQPKITKPSPPSQANPSSAPCFQLWKHQEETRTRPPHFVRVMRVSRRMNYGRSRRRGGSCARNISIIGWERKR